MDMRSTQPGIRRAEIARLAERMAARAESEGRSLWNAEEEARLGPLFEEFCRHLEAETNPTFPPGMTHNQHPETEPSTRLDLS